MDGNRLTDDRLETGLAQLEEEGLSASTLHQYRGYLRLFQQFLGQTKEFGPESLAQWQRAMAEEGVLSNSSINTRISAGNSLLRALGHPEWQVPKRLPEEPRTYTELTRQEYIRLLQMAKQQGKEQIYYIVKTICCTGVRVGELAHVTVELVETGQGSWMFQTVERRVRVPEPLRSELLQYAQRSGIHTGPVFRNRNGKPAARSTVWRRLQRVCQEAQVDPQKASPRCLERLYQHTQEDIAATVATLMEQAYAQQLQRENKSVGWYVV